jgi:hypothetical protein
MVTDISENFTASIFKALEELAVYGYRLISSFPVERNQFSQQLFLY